MTPADWLRAKALEARNLADSLREMRAGEESNTGDWLALAAASAERLAARLDHAAASLELED